MVYIKDPPGPDAVTAVKQHGETNMPVRTRAASARCLQCNGLILAGQAVRYSEANPAMGRHLDPKDCSA